MEKPKKKRKSQSPTISAAKKRSFSGSKRREVSVDRTKRREVSIERERREIEVQTDSQSKDMSMLQEQREKLETIE